MSDDKFRQRLFEESKRWQDENLLTPEQRDAILQQYVQENAAVTRINEFPPFIRAILALAVFLVGLAVFLLLSFNWQYLPGAAKLTIVGSVLAAAQAGGFWLRKSGWTNWADAAFFFAGIMYGVGIWQIGQVFHLPANWPMGLWLWAIGVFLMAMVVNSTPLHVLSVALLVGWVTTTMTGFWNPWRMITFSFVPFTAWPLPLFAAMGIGAGILREKRFVATLYVLLLVFWWIVQGVGCGLGAHLVFHVVAVGLICIALSSLYPQNTALGRISILLTFGGLLAPSFLGYWGILLYATSWRSYQGYNYNSSHVIWSFILPVINLLILYGLLRLGSRRKSLLDIIRRNKVVVISAMTTMALWSGSYFLSLKMEAVNHSRHYGYGWRERLFSDPLALGGMLAVNALIVMLSVWLIQSGLKRARGDWFWSGVLFFLIWAIVRYIDLFSGVGGMLGAAAIFLFCGLFMFGVAYYWITRRPKSPELEPLTECTPEIAFPRWMGRIWAGIRDKALLFWQSEQTVLKAIVIVAIIQFSVLGAMVANEMRPHVSGTTIRVTTIPVDPRDLFRGDYVILRYSFSRLNDLPGYYSVVNRGTDQTVFVTMQQEGDLWVATGVSRTRPREGVFLRGVLKSHGGDVVYGIESYFVQEGTGKAIEDAMRANRDSVTVELNVASDGKASIKTVHVQ